MTRRALVTGALGLVAALALAPARARAGDASAPGGATPQADAPSVAAPSAVAAPPERRRERDFYKGYDYGSQALYNPLYVFVNRGFDVLQLRPERRSPYAHDYVLNGGNVVDNLGDPFGAIGHQGWGKFLKEEVFPVGWTTASARWAPNYGLHLIGGGQSFAMLREWFEEHDVPTPLAIGFSAATLVSAGFLNETLENHDVRGVNTDCLADLYLFDVAGMLLFSIPQVRTLFSRYLILSDWSLQPSMTYPRGDLHNVGSYYALKIPVPFVPRLRLFGYEGFSSLGGLSYKIGDEYSVSLAAGGKISRFENSAADVVSNTVAAKPAAALFIDRNESLLASVAVADVPDYFVHVNLYPNAFVLPGLGVGLWTVVARDGRFQVGVSYTKALGLGLGAGTL